MLLFRVDYKPAADNNLPSKQRTFADGIEAANIKDIYGHDSPRSPQPNSFITKWS